MRKHVFYILLFAFALLMPLSSPSGAHGALGDFLYYIGSENPLSSPRHVATDASGNIYVANTIMNNIQVYDSSGNFIRKWGTYGTGDGQFRYPQGIAVDTSGNVYVADNFVMQVFEGDVVADTTPPVISTPANITAEATSAAGATVTYTAPSATDSVDLSPVVSCAPGSGSVFAIGTTGVICTATDSSGNSASSSFNVTVQDTIAPSV